MEPYHNQANQACHSELRKTLAHIARCHYFINNLQRFSFNKTILSASLVIGFADKIFCLVS